MRALVTGASGFVGRWLIEELLAGGHEVHATAPEATAPEALHGTTWHGRDLREPPALAELVDVARPEWVFHLAGISSVGAAEADPGAAAETNVTVTVRLLAALARLRDTAAVDPTVVVIGSGEQYGRQPAAAIPISETAPQLPLTLYAASKAAQEAFALQAYRRHGLRVIATRSFNHTGPGQSEQFLLPALVRRALGLRTTEAPVLRLGNMTPVRDIAHVADVVRAYILLAERGRPGEAYNVCSGIGHSVQDVAASVLRRAGVRASLEEDAALVRPVDVPALVGDNRKLRAETGWAPARTLDDCIDDLIHAATH